MSMLGKEQAQNSVNCPATSMQKQEQEGEARLQPQTVLHHRREEHVRRVQPQQQPAHAGTTERSGADPLHAESAHRRAPKNDPIEMTLDMAIGQKRHSKSLTKRAFCPEVTKFLEAAAAAD